MRILLMVALMACTPDMVQPMPDAGSGPDAPVGCTFPADPGVFGEACIEAVFPSVTTCQDGKGWCVAGRCEVGCSGASSSCSGCPIGLSERRSDRGACYCAR